MLFSFFPIGRRKQNETNEHRSMRSPHFHFWFFFFFKSLAALPTPINQSVTVSVNCRPGWHYMPWMNVNVSSSSRGRCCTRAGESPTPVHLGGNKQLFRNHPRSMFTNSDMMARLPPPLQPATRKGDIAKNHTQKKNNELKQ